MLRKTVSTLIFALLLIGISTSIIKIQPAEASETFYIRADGTLDPPIARGYIQRDGDQYIFTSNIHCSILVERDNILVDGAGHTLQGTGNGTGIGLSGRSNVTIRNVKIKGFYHGIALYYSSSVSIYYNEIEENNLRSTRSDGIYLLMSSNNTISGNNIENNGDGIELVSHSSNNRILGNNITNNMYGIELQESSNNTISTNNITNNRHSIRLLESSNFNSISKNDIIKNKDGIQLYDSSNNTISGNHIAAINYGVYLDVWSSNNIFFTNKITNSECGVFLDCSSNNMFYHNCFMNNTVQANSDQSSNVWDNGFEGNYWSNYTGADLDRNGTGDTPHVINEDNKDNYPLMNPYVDVNHDGQVNIIDLYYTAKAFGTNLGDPNYNLYADIDWNDTVNIVDLYICAYWFGHHWQN